MNYRIFSLLFFLYASSLSAQEIKIAEIGFRENSILELNSVKLIDNQIVNLQNSLPLFTILINDSLRNSAEINFQSFGDSLSFQFTDNLHASIKTGKDHLGNPTFILRINNLTFNNLTINNLSDTLVRIENLVPLGQSGDHVYITASGSYDWPGYLCRSKLFIPGQGPVGIVLPDNAWHLGFSDVKITGELSLVALARRTKTENADVRRWWTDLKPGGSVEYTIWFDVHTGDWHEGLRKMFRERFLYIS